MQASKLMLLWLLILALCFAFGFCVPTELIAQSVTAKATLKYIAPGVDQNGHPLTYTRSEIKIVVGGGKSSDAPVEVGGQPLFLKPVPTIGENVVDLTAAIDGLPAGVYYVFWRTGTSRGYSAYAGPVSCNSPLTGQQEAQPIIPKTTPIKPQGGKLTVELVTVEGPPVPTPEPIPSPVEVRLQTVFADNEAPTAQSTDANSYDLGLRFRSSVAGNIVGVRFYRAAGNNGPHKISLWDVAGTQLATKDVGVPTAVGWQSHKFDSAVAMVAGAAYIVSYYCPNGRYSVSINYFLAADKNAGVLTAPRSNANALNGVYKLNGGFPNGSYAASNYGVDPMVEVAIASITMRPVTLAWDAPATNEDGSALNIADVVKYLLNIDGVEYGLPAVLEWSGELSKLGHDAFVQAVKKNGKQSQRSSTLRVADAN